MYQDGARRCFFEKNKRTLKKSLSVQPLGMVRLRHYRIIQRVWIGAKICAAKRRKTAGILCVLQGFATHLWGKLAAKTRVGNCAVMP